VGSFDTGHLEELREMMEVKGWADLTPDQRQEARFKRWLSPQDITFVSHEAEQGYKERVARLVKAIKLEEPDRVPVSIPAGFFPAYYAGMTLKTVMHDYDELRRAWLKFLHDFELDTFSGPAFVYPSKVFDLLDYKLQRWPGHGLGDNISSYQYVEGEYMLPDEYDAVIKDPYDFLVRTWLPRTVGAFAGFKKLGPMPLLEALPVFYLPQFADPEVRASILALLDAAQESAKWLAAVAEVSKAAREAGVPTMLGGRSRAPYDFFGDTLRGTKGVMMDMFQRPEKLQDAMERVTPIIIDRSVKAANASASPVVIITLHKGPGGFMSNKQFETFYWPTLRKVMMGLIEEGLVPMPFAEGDYQPRLEIIKDMPRGKVIWHFETMDMAKAKEVLGDNACIAGNLPTSVLCTGTPEDVKEGCRRLIETCAPGGGYVLTGAAAVDEGNPDNLRAMMEAAKEYGVYG
jgi:uroporphyrinogen-III decarboxylase